MGKGSMTLGLAEVDPDAFQAVLEGKDLAGNTLVAAASNGEHRAGWDLHFAPSKSISLAWAFGDEQQRQDMLSSHHEAVESVMRYIEDNLIEARATDKGNTVRIATGNMIAARFDHFTSRELDPQLHSHVVVANMTRRPDGQWRAVANEKIFARELLTALYENELAAGLKERGYAVSMEKHDTGNSRYVRIEGIDDKVIEHFSKRQDQIDKAVASLKERYPQATPGELRQMACLETRQPKQTIDREVLHDSWNRQLEGLGYARESLRASLARETRQPGPGGAKEIINTACLAINEQESTFTREDVIKTAARISGGDHRNADLERAFHDLKGRSIVTLDRGTGIYTTKAMQKTERGIVAMVMDGHDTVPAVLGEDNRQGLVGRYDHLISDQQIALEHILTSRDRVIGIQGDAGTGKTTMLGAAREQLEAQGFTIRGFTFTGKAAKELQGGAGVESQTLHSFLPKLDSPEFVPSPREAWFIDEVSMVGSRQMSDLIKAAEKANARLVLVGDTKQLQSIQAGKMFSKLQEIGAMKTVHMKETLRQKDEDYKAMVAEIAAKRIDNAFRMMEQKGKVHEIADDGDRHSAIVKEFVSKKDYRNTLVVTPLNRNRNELNERIRDRLKEKGTLNVQEHSHIVKEPKVLSPIERHLAESYSRDDIVAVHTGLPGFKVGDQARVLSVDPHTQSVNVSTLLGHNIAIDVSAHGHKLGIYREKVLRFAEGDKVVFLKNDRNLGVQNGLTGEIKHIDERGNITVTKDTGKDLTWNMRHAYNYLDHGYAVTDYKGQGQTSREVIFHAVTAERTTSYNSFYVATTRGRDNLHIYTDSVNRLREQVKRENHKTSSLDHVATIDKSIPGERSQPTIQKAKEGR
ncbi:MAG: Multifunctional conjugation protein TraI [Syntrophorhabdaceae bacterium PtaU1.Bin034]|nr:MAG: Multifunctional conjugation protein TraI [Syntrophorhabdaceae bacterium PtaU1.Bin034]